MKQFVTSIANASYQRVITTALIVGLLIGVSTIGIRTAGDLGGDRRLGGQSIGTITPAPQITKRPPGPIPIQPPRLTGVFPWIGKVGDVILIQGEHFGDNPKEKQISIGGIRIEEQHILDWTDLEIQAFIPSGAAQGGVVEVTVGTHPPVTSLPLTLYDSSTRLQLKKIGTVITSSLPSELQTIRWWGARDETVELHEITRSVLSDPILFDTQGEEIRSLLLYDAAGTMLPYYVDPEEFGF